jgi:uncharacterized membrane protein YphA (DoxX/SURF4 family)
MIRSLATIGRYFFAITMIVFGLQQCAFAVLRSGQIFGPPWIVRNPFLVLVIGIVLVFGGLSIVVQFRARLGAQLLASMMLVYVIAIYLPRMVGNPRNPGFWTSAAELLCLAGAAFVAAGNGVANTGIRTESFSYQYRAFFVCAASGGFCGPTFYVCPICGDTCSGMDSRAPVLGMLCRCGFYRGQPEHYFQDKKFFGRGAAGAHVFSVGRDRTCTAHCSGFSQCK